MADPDIGTLFDDSRFPGGIKLLFVLLYMPIGVILSIVRIFIGFQTFLVSCLLPKSWPIRGLILRTLCGVLGIIVTTEGMENRQKRAKILVSNYTSTLDHLATDLVIPSVLPSVWDLPSPLMWLLGYKDMGARQGREVLIRNASKHIKESSIPLLVFPEGASTNGKTGLLKFSVWPFSMDEPLQAMVIRITRPMFTEIAPAVLGGRWWIDVWWFLFVPYSVFHIKVLPVVEEREEETVEEFTRRTQELLAGTLLLQPTQYTSADKVEYTKKKLFLPAPAPEAAAASTPGIGDAIDMMVYQVKEVLPHVPPQAIRADLTMTKDVDLTITNILEGRVEFSDEAMGIEADPPAPASPPSANTAKQAKPSTPSTPSFAKQSNLRSASLEERKKAMIDYARHKYKEKHGLL